MIEKLQESFNLILVHMIFDIQQLYITNIYVTGDLAFFSFLLDKEHANPEYSITYTLRPKVWSECSHNNGGDWTIDVVKLMSQLYVNGLVRLCVKEEQI